MKKTLATCLSAMMLTCFLFTGASLAETKPQAMEFAGLITEVIDGGILIQDVERGTVLLNVDPETVLEGVLAETPLKEGMYVFAKSSGILTRTSPPQTHADRLGCYTLEGDVAEMVDGGILLTGDKLFGDVIVRLNEHMPHVFGGVPITVYYDGSMAMSLPGKVTARYIVVPVIKGTVKSMDEDALTLVDGNGKTVRVAIEKSTLLPASWFSGDLEGRSAIIYYDGGLEGEGGNSQILRALEVVDPSSITLPSEPLEAPQAGAEPTATPQGLVDNDPEGGDEATQTPGATPEPSASPAPSESPDPEETEAPTATQPETSPTPAAEGAQ